MDDSQKKNLMIGIIVVCLIAGGYLVYANLAGGGGGIDSIPSDEMVWVKCTNKSCQAEYQMNKRQYHEEAEEVMRKNPMASLAPVKCEKCGNNTALLAEKCPYCETVFITGTNSNDQPDRCPNCKKSAIEESRKERKKAKGG